MSNKCGDCFACYPTPKFREPTTGRIYDAICNPFGENSEHAGWPVHQDCGACGCFKCREEPKEEA